jgi:Tfp pilus assembly protein PilF
MYPLRIVAVLIVFAVFPAGLLAQAKPAPGGAPSRPSVPVNVPSTRSSPAPSQPIFITGKVLLDNGMPPSEPVPIERVCNGSVRREGYTDSKGHFSFMIGDPSEAMVVGDASEDATLPMPGRSAGGLGQTPNLSGPGMNSRNIQSLEQQLWACELRASLPGYTSSILQLAGHHALDDPDVGRIVLKHIGNVEGDTISATSLAAPGNARKELAKAREIGAKKPEEAEKHLRKAVEVYPQYAAAWLLLGKLQSQRGALADARTSYQQAVTADAKFVQPYVELAYLSAMQQQWQEVAQYAEQAIRLDPVDNYLPYYLDAVANIRLKRIDDAQRSANKAEQIDREHHEPRIALVQANLCAMKRDYVSAASHLRDYLTVAPNAPDATQVKSELARLEQLTAAATPAATPAAIPPPK